MRRVLVFLATGALTVAMGVPASAGGDGATRRVYPPDGEPFGMSYAEWHGAYQIWLNEIPTRLNPLVDPLSPRNCEVQPGGDVVFVGSFGADCALPEGAAIVIGTASWECSTAEGLGDTFAELRQCARESFERDFGPEQFHQRLLIDGEHLRYTRRWITTTPGEIIDFPKNNIWDAKPGPSKSVSEGFLFILRPLREGTHRIVAKVTSSTIGDFTVVWKLHVVDHDD